MPTSESSSSDRRSSSNRRRPSRRDPLGLQPQVAAPLEVPDQAVRRLLRHLPARGELHWWRNVGNGPGRHLEIFVPAGLERMFEEIGEPITDPDASPSPPDPKRLLEAAPRYGVEFKLPQ